MIYAPDREGDHDGIDFVVDRVGIQEKILTAGVELLVIRKDVIDLVSCCCSPSVLEVCSDLDIFGRESGLLILVKLILLEFREIVKHPGGIQVIRVIFAVVRVEIVHEGLLEADVLHVEVAFSGSDRVKSQLNLGAAFEGDKGQVIGMGEGIAHLGDLVRNIPAFEACGEVRRGAGILQRAGRLRYGMGQEDLLPLSRRKGIKLLAGNSTIIGVAQGKGCSIAIDGICCFGIQRGVGIARGKLLGMQAVEIAYRGQLVKDGAVVEVRELPRVVVDIRYSQRVQVVQDIRAVHTPERLCGGKAAQQRGVLVPESGLCIGGPDKGRTIVSDRFSDLRHIVDPHVAVVGGRGVQARPERRKTEEIFVFRDPVVEAGIILINAVGTDSENRKENDPALGAAEPGFPAAGCLGVFRLFCSGSSCFRFFRSDSSCFRNFRRGRFKQFFLRKEEIEERDAGEDERNKEIGFDLICDHEAHGKIQREAGHHRSFLRSSERKQERPQLGDDHGDEGGISPAPAVDRVGKAVGQITESRDEQEDRIQQELQSKLDKTLCTKKKEDAQKSGPRVAEGAVLNFIAGKKIEGQHAAGQGLVKEIDGRIEGDPLIAQDGDGHREQDHSAHGDTYGTGGEHDADLGEASSQFSPCDREIAEQRVHYGHKDNAHDKVEIAYCREEDG